VIFSGKRQDLQATGQVFLPFYILHRIYTLSVNHLQSTNRQKQIFIRLFNVVTLIVGGNQMKRAVFFARTEGKYQYFLQVLFWGPIFFILSSTPAAAQDCPDNIDFESGTFNNWTCYTGTVAASAGQNIFTLSPVGGPVAGQHTMYGITNGNERDYFGNFPVLCPNGSGHSIKLGNNSGGHQAEGISYEFTIPANRNNFALVYHYAVVFQDPSHQPHQQPRLEIEATNVTDAELISCSSFTFFASGSPLPGFFVSSIQQDTTDVWCKNWTQVTMNLSGMAGKTIRLFFKTGDCTFNRHFGYAYIDVDSECGGEFTGAVYCPDDTAVNLTAPFGYQNYTWYNNNFSQVLGSSQNLSLTPPPPNGTTIAVEVIPYNGYGCKDTFYAVLYDTLTLKADAGPDGLSCNQESVPVGARPKHGVVYSWSPAAGLSDATIANPRASPAVTTTYVLSIRSTAGGCRSTDTVVVTASVIDTSLTLLGKPSFCITSNDSAVLVVPPTTRIQWYRGNNPIAGATGTRFRVMQSGSYYALLENDLLCRIATTPRNILIEEPLPGILYPVKNAAKNISMPLEARNIGITALWKPPAFLNNAQTFKPTFRGAEDQRYTITLTTAAGCVTVDTQLVKVYDKINFYVPGAFTPNGDGLNDYLIPVATGITEIVYFRVYNRWGQLLYDHRGELPGWNGTHRGVPQPMQTVVWMAEGMGADNQRYRQQGTAVLIR
jgi:gliding motility-associated-like protein